MPLIRAFAVPHPPLAVPSVGRGKENEIPGTIDAFKKMARLIARDRPELIVFISPHGTVYDDYIHISPGARGEGSFARFGAGGKKYALEYDALFIKRLCELSERDGIEAGTLGRETDGIDHGVLVPLHYIAEEYAGFKGVRISISGLPLKTHYLFGALIKKTIDELGRKTVLIASGDLSHKLTLDGPYGYAKEGPEFDSQVADAFKRADFLKLMTFEPSFCEKAAECGLRSFIMMAGLFDGFEVGSELYSYEGPFGVGYAVSVFNAENENESRRILTEFEIFTKQKTERIRMSEDPYVKLARYTLEEYIKTGRVPARPDWLPDEMLTDRAGTFVSIKKDGALRGCIGTTEPYRENIADEIMGNAISSGTRDSRFQCVTENELDSLIYSVDVLSQAEEISGPEELNVDRYGVIVISGNRRGLLLPNLDGVDTVSEQLSIARRKAGISEAENVRLMRFEVVRHK